MAVQLTATWIARVFDKCPLGILQVSGDGKVLYLNPTGLQLCGLDTWENKTIRDLFPDEKTYNFILHQLSARLQGFSDEYEVELTRPDNLKRIPIRVAAMPVVTNAGNVVGAISIFRSLELDKASRAFTEHINAAQRPAELLVRIAEEIRKVIHFDSLSITDYSRDMKEARVLLEYPSQFVSPIERWFTVSPSLTEWVQLGTRTKKFLPDLYAASNDPSLRLLIQNGYKWMLRCPVHGEGRLIGSISLFTKDARGFSDREFELFHGLPLGKALLATLFLRSREELQFRYQLVKDISNCKSDRELFELLVDRLSVQYGWSHVSVFTVDEIEQHFCLQSQRSYGDASLLPTSYNQSIQEGVLGYVYRTDHDANIPNVKADERFKDIVLRKQGIQVPSSELCLRIIAEGKTYALLNVEDSRTNGFSRDEEDLLRNVLDEIGSIIDRRRKEIEIVASFNATATAVFLADKKGIIRRVNQAAARFLGYDPEELVGTSIAKYVSDPHIGTALAKALNPTGEIEMVKKDGTTIQALVGGSPIEGAIDRRQITFRDTSVQRRGQELEDLTKLYSELARQIKTPLSIVGICLRDLKDFGPTRGSDRIMALLGRPTRLEQALADAVDKIIRQLHRVELTYDTLVLYGSGYSPAEYRPVCLNIRHLLEETLSEVPELEASRICCEYQTTDFDLIGDPWQLAWITQTVLTHLLRFSTPRTLVKLRLTDDKSFLRIAFEGHCPERTSSRRQKPRADLEFASTMMDLSFATPTLRRFVDNHKGVLRGPTEQKGLLTFEIELPRTQDARV